MSGAVAGGVAAAAAACTFRPLGLGGDLADAPAAAPDALAPLGPFGAPVPIVELDTALYGEDDPSLTADLLEIYFGSERPGGMGMEDIWMASRAAPGDPWGAALPLATLNSPQTDQTMKVAPDGLSIYLASNRPASQGADLWVSTRPARGLPWPAPVPVTPLNSASGDWAAIPADDLRSIVSNRDGDEDLYEAFRAAAADPWGAPAKIVGLATPGNECDPAAPGGGVIFFASTQTGSLGDYDLWTAPYTPGAGAGPATPLTELNTAGRDRDPWVSPDLRMIVFSSDRDGSDDLFVAVR